MQQRLGKNAGNTRALSRGIIALCAAAATGCSHYSTYISSVADPAYSPAKTDPIFVALPPDPSIEERQLAGILRAQLCRDGYKTVESPRDATWIMGLTYERRSIEFGSSTYLNAYQGLVFHGTGLVTGATETTVPNVVNRTSAYLTLLKPPPTPDAKSLSVWEGNVSTDSHVFQVYKPIIFKPLLEQIGHDAEGDFRLSKSYLSSLTPCP
jgi:hypothetical protein